MGKKITCNHSLRAVVYGLIAELRPRQWYKQSVMLVGILFSGNLLNGSALIDLSLAVGSFTAVSGSIYIINDILDVEEDRQHPTKRYRPIASGMVPIQIGAFFGTLLLMSGVIIGFNLNVPFGVILLYYILQNIVYSAYLKELIFVDIIVVAVGFVLRAIAGVVVIGVYLSPWLIVCTFLLALVLALGKRRHEIETIEEPENSRQVLKQYSQGELDQLVGITMGTLLISYSLYSFNRADPLMLMTLPFAFYGVFRYHHLIHTTSIAGQPEYIFTDIESMINLLLWVSTTVGIIYNLPELIA